MKLGAAMLTGVSRLLPSADVEKQVSRCACREVADLLLGFKL